MIASATRIVSILDAISINIIKISMRKMSTRSESYIYTAKKSDS